MTKKHKVEIIKKYINTRLTGYMRNHLMNAVYEIENAKKLNEDRLDKVFFNYLDNLESDIKSKDYWKQRFFE